jgi:hypothetical protein
MRWFKKRGPTRVLFRNDVFRRLNQTRLRAACDAAARRDPERFADVRTFCLFIGHMKSGTSLIGSLLDAHPNAVVSDEADALRFVEEAGFSRLELFHMLDRAARTEARRGRVTARRLGGYSLAVPGGYQGRSERPLVVGDGRAGPTTTRLDEDPAVLERFRTLLGDVALRVVWVVRNPFGPIGASTVRGERTFEQAIDHYFARCDALARVGVQLDGVDVLTVRYEDLVADPRGRLGALCAFLGLEVEGAYLSRSAALVVPKAERLVEWEEPWISQVESRMRAYDFLSGYAYEPGVMSR